MAIDKAVDSAALDAGMTAVADAIRAKAGTTEPLAWPDGFITAISGETGSGDSADSIIDQSITSITSSAAEVGQYAFYGCGQLETASFPEATTIRAAAFIGCKALVSISCPKVTEIRSDAINLLRFDEMAGGYEVDTVGPFEQCANLTTVNFPMAETLYKRAFSGCTGLTTLKFPRVKTIGVSDNTGGGGVIE